MTITIGIVASSREWRSILQAHVRDHVADVKVQILREPRMALELELDVVVIDDVSSFLTRDKVVRLREKGTRVVGIYDPEGQEGLGITFLENLGVDLSLPSNISPEEMISAVSQLQPRENYSNVFDHAVADFSSTQTPTVEPGNSAIITVAGPAGTGSTEIAIALADLLVARRTATLLIDCDEVGPSVARRIGFHLHPNILTAMDAVANVTKPLTEMVGRPSDRVANSVNFDVIPGIANPEDWSQLRSSDIADLFTAARKSWRYIVCNTGPFTEDLSGYGMERFGGTRAALEYADVIIGVMSPTTTGYMRFLDWLSSLRSLGHDRAVYVVVNRAPKSGYIRKEIESQLTRDVDSRYIAGLFFVAEDEKVTKAEWEGQLVSRGPFLNTVAEVATFAIPARYVKKNSKGAQGVVQTSAGTAFSGAPIAAPNQMPSQAQGISWDDPDIAGAPQVPMPPQAPAQSVMEPQPLASEVSPYITEQPQNLNIDSIDQIDEIENSIAHSMQQSDYETQAQQPTPQDNSYSFSPPIHSVEHVTPSPAQVPQSPADPTSQSYVPAYKRDSQEQIPDANEQFVNAQPPEPTNQGYVNQENVAQQGKGYVPGYVEEDKEENPDDKFWGN